MAASFAEQQYSVFAIMLRRVLFAVTAATFSVLCEDAGGNTGFQVMDTCTIYFTNNPVQFAVHDKAAVDTVLNFSVPFGTNYNGTWLSGTVLRLTVQAVSGTARTRPTIPGFAVGIKSGFILRNDVGTSLPFGNTMVTATGLFGTYLIQGLMVAGY